MDKLLLSSTADNILLDTARTGRSRKSKKLSPQTALPPNMVDHVAAKDNYTVSGKKQPR